MSDFERIRTTSDGCVTENDMHLLAHRPKENFRVQSIEGPITRTMVRMVSRGRLMLADVVTGTLYDSRTGRSNSIYLSIIRKQK